VKLEGLSLSSSYFPGPMTEIDVLIAHMTPLPSSSNEHHSPAVTVPDGDRQDETQDIGLESMRTGKTATRIACTVLPVPLH